MKEQVIKTLKKIEILNQTLKESVPEEYKPILGDLQRFNFSQISDRIGAVMEQMILETKKKSILELGTSAAYSTLFLASAAKENNGTVYTIESDEKKLYFAKKHIEESGLNNIELIEGNILEALDAWDTKIDFLFIDAQKSNYLEYLKKLEPFLEKEAIIVADNVKTITGGTVNVENKTKPYVEYVENNKQYQNIMIEEESGVMVSVKSH